MDITFAETEKVQNSLRKQGKFSEEQILNCTIEKSGVNKFNFSVPVPARKFIKELLIDDLAEVIKVSIWSGFVLIGCGIEVLGKAIDPLNPMDWDVSGKSGDNFNDAVRNIPA